MKEIKKYSDLDLSFIPNPKTGDLTPKFDEAAIKRAALHLIKLNAFDIPFKPQYKSNLKNFLFEKMDQIDDANLKADISTVLRALEPRIKVKGVSIKHPEPKQMIVTISYSCESIDRDGQFDLTVEKVR